ncbi:zinc finger, CCHC-type containing protein [Tanacetum coccineum]
MSNRTTVVLVQQETKVGMVGRCARLVTSKGIVVVVKRTMQILVVLGKWGSKNHSQDQGQNLVHVWNRFIKYSVSLISEAFYVQVDAIAWWIDSGATTHVCKDRCWFKTYEPVEDGSVLYMGDDHFAPVHGKGSVVLEFSSGKSITLFNVLYVPKLRKNLISGPVLNKCGYKQVYESDKYILSKCGVFVGFGYYNNGMFMLNLNKVPDDSDSVYMSSSTVVNSSLWHARLGHVHYKRMLEMSKDDLIPAIDENPEKCTTCMLTKITRKPFKSITRKSVILELIHSDLCDFHATPSLGNKKYVITFIDDAFRFWAVVRLPDQERKTLGEKGIDCIFVGYAEHSKGYRFYVIEPNDSVSINSIIESRDAIFDQNHFFSIPRPKDVIPNSVESQRDDHSDDVPSEVLNLIKAKDIEEDPRTYNEAMQSRDATFWKEAIDDEIGFKQKEGIDYFDTYALVARITTIRLLLALAAIHNLVIHQMDVKTAFLNGDSDEEVYMKQLGGFVMPCNEHKVEKLKPNTGKPMDQLEYSRAIGSLMYAMTSTRPDIAYVVGRLSRFTSNPSRQHWQAITRVFKYLKGTMNYGLSYFGYPSVLEGYSDASWINYVENSSSTSGWVFLLGGCVISWASKKQTCITGSTMESEFVALVVAGKEAEWLRNLIHEIPIWPKPIASISIHCDSAATLAKAYSQMYNGKSRHLGILHLEEIHVTWAYLEKKRTRLRTYTNIAQEFSLQKLKTASQITRDAVTTISKTTSQDLKMASDYENPIRTLRDYSKPSHEGYRNTIELPVGNKVVPLRSDTIRLVQNGCSFYGLRSEDPNQHLKDFLKLVDSLDLDGENKERTRLCLFQFSLRDQASNWLERLPAGSITTCEDLTTRFLAQFFLSRRTVKLRNDILMFQQHHRESISEAWTRFKDLLQKVPHHGIYLWLQV